MKTWNSFPMLRVITPFVLGVVSMSFLVEDIPWDEFSRIIAVVGFCVGILAALLVAFIAPVKHFGISVWLLMILSGAGLVASISASVYPENISAENLGVWKTFIIEVDDEPRVKQNSIEVIANASDENVTGSSRVLLYFHRDTFSAAIRYGDVLTIRTKLEEVQNLGNPNEFNYKRYLRFNGISLRGYVGEGKASFIDTDNPGLWGRLHAIRSFLIEKLEKARISGNELAVASALILGYRAELDKELMSAYAGAGATHVLAVSGLHVGIVYFILNTLLKFMDKRHKTKVLKTIILILLLFGYASLTGLSASVFRAATMFSFVAVGKAIKRDTNIFNTLAASAFVLMAIEPLIIMQVGFQLSYAAVLGIVVIQPRLFALTSFPNSRILDWAWSITCVSIAAQIATAPLGLLYFHQFPNFFWVSNLFVIPAAGLILYLGFSLFVFSCWEPTHLFFGFLLEKVISILNRVVIQIEKIPYSVLGGIDISTTETMMIYAMITGVLLFIIQKSRYGLYSALSIAIVFSAMQIHESFVQRQQQFITIYNVRGETAVGLFNGKHVIFISSREFYEDEKAMLFHVRHHWWNRGVETENFVELTDSITNRKLKWNDRSLLIADLSRNREHNTELSIEDNNVDLILLGDIDWESCQILDELKTKQLVVTNLGNTKLIRRIKDQVNTEVHLSLVDDGAIFY